MQFLYRLFPERHLLQITTDLNGNKTVHDFDTLMKLYPDRVNKLFSDARWDATQKLSKNSLLLKFSLSIKDGTVIAGGIKLLCTIFD